MKNDKLKNWFITSGVIFVWSVILFGLNVSLWVTPLLTLLIYFIYKKYKHHIVGDGDVLEHVLTEENIRQRAHKIWLETGCEDSEKNWKDAVDQLTTEYYKYN